MAAIEPVSGHVTASVPHTRDWHPLTVHAFPMPAVARVRYEASCGCGGWDAAAVGTGVRGALYVSTEHAQHRRTVT